MTGLPTPTSSASELAHAQAPRAAPHLRLLRLLITGVPTGVAVRVIAAVTASLSMLGIVLFGALADTEFGPHLHEVITIGIAVPLIVVMPFASVAIQLVRQLERERANAIALAELDPLTGLLNRRRFGELLERDGAIAVRGGRTWMVAMLDIDDFKSVNDLHGHAAGDALLQAVAQTCRRTLRTSDVVARWGGEEFVLLMPDAGVGGGAALLERLRAAIASTVVRDGSNQPIARTVSIGAVIMVPRPSWRRPPAALQQIGLADRTLYRSKSLGKDRVVTEEVCAPSASGGQATGAGTLTGPGRAVGQGRAPHATSTDAALGAPSGAPAAAPLDIAAPNRAPSRATRETI